MPASNNNQVQKFVDERVRVRCEAIRDLLLAVEDDLSAIDDVYAALTQATPTWTDTRTDGPPHLLVGNDVLAMNTLFNDLKAMLRGNAQLPIALKACVRPVG